MRYRKSAFAMAAFFVATSGTSHAQQANAPETPAAGADNQDIIVTAQKREQRLNDVGISIVAATGAQLKTAGITDVSQLAKVTPGFSVGGTSTGGYKVFSLRGINFNADQISAPPAVSVYVDQIVLPYSAMTANILLDVERVEVLKGPQGTLFGQNATGGSINVIAAKPTSTLKAGFSAEVNHFGQVELDGYVSGPVSDTVRARLAATTTQFGAWQRGYYLSNRKNGDQNKGAARLLVDWTPTDRLKFELNLNASYDHGEQTALQFAGFSSTTPAAANPGLATYPLPHNNRDADIQPGLDTHAHNSLYQAALRMDYDLTDGITLTSLTSYSRFKYSMLRDLDATAYAILNTNPHADIKAFTQEIRLTGKALDNRLTYIVGGNYQNDKIIDTNINLFPGYSTLPVGAELITAGHVRNRAAGVFGNVDFEFLPKLTFTGGLRYTETKESYNGCMTGNAQAAGVTGFISNLLRGFAGLPATNDFVAGGCLSVNDVPSTPGGTADFLPVAQNASQKEHNVSWRAGLNYKPTPDTLVYGIISRGYKAGLYPVQQNILNSQFLPVKQEKLTAYEVGAKLGLLDHMVQLNVAGFYYQYNNKQFNTFQTSPIGGTGYITNVPKSTVKGFEAELTVVPVRELTLKGSVTRIYTKTGPFKTLDFLGNPIDATGTEFNFAPPWSGIFDAQYNFHTSGSLSPYVGVGGSFNSRTFSALGEAPNSLIPGYVLVDARVGVVSANGWRAGLFVRNLTDKHYWLTVFGTGDTTARVIGLPRTFGANFSVNF